MKRPGLHKKKEKKTLSSGLVPTEAFQDLKSALVNSVPLAHPKFTKPFLLSVDASPYGLGAVLCQIKPNECKAQPIAFASTSLNHAQS